MVEFRRRMPKCLECGAADEAQFRIAQRSDRSRAWSPVDHGELADDRTGSEYCEDALPARRRGDTRLEQAFLNAIASVALFPCHKQGLGAASETGRALAKRLCDNSIGKAANRLSGRGTDFGIGSLVRLTGRTRNRISADISSRKVAP